MNAQSDRPEPWIDPDMQPILEALRERIAQRPAADAVSVEELRRRTRDDLAPWNENLPGGIIIEDEAVQTGHGERRLRVVQPPNADTDSALVWLHGGGFVVGDANTHLRLAAELALAASMPVALPEYALAPEHPYPGPIHSSDELIDAALALLRPQRLLLGGDSAGAALALAATLERRKLGKPLPLSLVLVYGCYAPRFDTDSHRRLGRSFGITTDVLRFFWDTFLAGKPPKSADLLVGDLAGLPETYLVAAGLDPLLDDTLDLARRLTAYGVPVTLRCDPGVIHGYLHMTDALGVARRTLRSIGDFVQRSLPPSGE